MSIVVPIKSFKLSLTIIHTYVHGTPISTQARNPSHLTFPLSKRRETATYPFLSFLAKGIVNVTLSVTISYVCDPQCYLDIIYTKYSCD